MTGMRVKVFFGRPADLEASINEWLESSPEVEVRDIKIGPGGAEGEALALVQYFPPKSRQQVGFGHRG